MSKRVMKHSAAESLEKLRDVISSVNKQCRSRHDPGLFTKRVSAG